MNAPKGYEGLHILWSRDSTEVLEVTKECFHQIAIDALIKYNMARELLNERRANMCYTVNNEEQQSRNS